MQLLFLHTKYQLEDKIGFTQTDLDACLFISNNMICLIYVDDALLFFKENKAITKLTSCMMQHEKKFWEAESLQQWTQMIKSSSPNRHHHKAIFQK